MLRPLLCALGFLTRVPLPAIDCSESDMARSAGYFAWVGGFVALPLGALALLAPHLGARVAAVLIVAVWAWITGGLHLDGLADSVDGFSGGRGQPERTLEIMRDSRIGSHGALALALVLLLKFACLERLIGLQAWSWLVAPVWARFLCTGLMAAFAYVRPRGLGQAFAGRVGGRALTVGALGLLAPFPLLWQRGELSLELAWAAAASTSAALALALKFKHRLGGLTGDGYGAAIELSEAACLLALCLR
ncbi:MAG TPA: adenosylcobinamide-GDP ribazoletransferase [Polyangiales bacterium]